MGNTQSAQNSKDKSPDKKITLPGIIDSIATKYILTQDFEDLLKLDDVNYCNKLVILTSKIIGDRLNNIEIQYLDQRIKDGIEINTMNKDNIMYLKKDTLNKLDIQNSVKKKRVCIGIAKFYIKIAHLFSAIVSIMSPEYEFTTNSTKSRIPYMKKGLLSQEEKSKAKLSRNGLCYRRIQSIIEKQLEDTDVELKINVCDLNRLNKQSQNTNITPQTTFQPVTTTIPAQEEQNTNITPQTTFQPVTTTQTQEDIQQQEQNTDISYSTFQPVTTTTQAQEDIQQEENKDISYSTFKPVTQIYTDVSQNIYGGTIEENKGNVEYPTMTLVDEPGIPELYKLYMDKFDYNKSKFIGITDETMKQYKKDLYKFYVAFTGNKVMPDNIQKFSDIKLKDYHNNPSCKKDMPFNKSYKINKNSRTYKNYGKQLSLMLSKMNMNYDKLINILNEVFVYRIEPITKNKEITLHPGLTYKKLDSLIVNSREIIVDLYIGCELDYTNILDSFETIIEEQIRKNTNAKIENIQKQAQEILSEL